MNARENDINFEVFYIKKDTPLDEIKNIETRFQRVILGSSDALRVRGFKTDIPTICVSPDIALGTLEALFRRLVSSPQICIGILSDASIEAIKMIPIEAIKMIPVKVIQVHLYDISKEAIQALPKGLSAVFLHNVSKDAVFLHNVSKDTIRHLPEHITGVTISGMTPLETVKELPPHVKSVGILFGVLPSTVAALPEHITTVHIYPESPIDAIEKIPLHIKMAYIHGNLFRGNLSIVATQAIPSHIEKRFVPDDSAEKKREREPEKNAHIINQQLQPKRARVAAESAAPATLSAPPRPSTLMSLITQVNFSPVKLAINQLEQKYDDLLQENAWLRQQMQELLQRNQKLEEENKNFKNPLPPIQPTPIKPSYMPRPEILNSNTPTIPVPQTAARQQGFAPVHGVAIMPSSVSSTHFAAGRSVVIKQEPLEEGDQEMQHEGSTLTK